MLGNQSSTFRNKTKQLSPTITCSGMVTGSSSSLSPGRLREKDAALAAGVRLCGDSGFLVVDERKWLNSRGNLIIFRVFAN